MVKSGDQLEVEVKFLVPALDNIREKLLDSGAKLLSARTLEQNIRFDNAWQGLKLQGKLLRLRQDAAARLTFKGQPDSPVDSEVRVRKELEIEVSDFETAAAILEQLGFERLQVYEKYRETFQAGAVEVVLDEMPFGEFVELEGEETAIRSVSGQLELDWDKRILANYLALMAELKAFHNLAFDDVTFVNFADLNISMADILDFAQ